MDEGRDLPDDILLPYTPPPEEDAGYDNAPRRGYEQGRERLRPAPIRYEDDSDQAAEAAWIGEALARGNEVDLRRRLEINPRTGEVVSEMPAFRRMT